jgi:hypothetical protein
MSAITCAADAHAVTEPDAAGVGLQVFVAVVADQLSRPTHDAPVTVNVDDTAGPLTLQVRSFEPEPRRAAHACALVACSRHSLKGERDQGHVRSLETGRRKTMMYRTPLGPDGTWKTGQRVGFDGIYEDQYGTRSHHQTGATFPCIDRKGECAYRFLVEQSVAAG